jgi:AcrR family transcriptional regulator
VLKSSLPTLQARKQQLVRDAIWDAAVDLFISKGFDETTVDNIVEAAGISRRSFFRYFSSKNDLMAHAVVNYGTSLNETIRACPRDHSLPEVFRETVRKVASQTTPSLRTRKIMEIAAKYPAAREAQLSRLAEVQDQVAEVYAERCTRSRPDDPTPHLLAALTLSTLTTSFRSWFHNGAADISVTVDHVLATLSRLVCEHEQLSSKGQRKRSTPPRSAKSQAHARKS